MSFAFLGSLPLLSMLLLAGCEREQRDFHAQPQDPKHYERDAWDVAQGKQLFQWMNCTGCHSHGGGGMGPALSDDKWLYGGKLQQIYISIRDGRPNGMPAWRKRLTTSKYGSSSPYVRSMGDTSVRTSRPAATTA